MKYLFLFCGTRESQAAWEALSQEQMDQALAKAGEWFSNYGSRITGGYQLQGPETATTVSHEQGGRPVVKDGPFIEGKEVIGGYAEVEADDLDQAIEMAKKWPAGPVEIRPVVERRVPTAS